MFDFNLLFVVCFGVGVEGLKYVMVLGVWVFCLRFMGWS